MLKPRLLSLDAMRGLTVALMILVNNAGDGTVSYAQLRHSVWNGCTITDVVFPMFLFIVGASIELALSSRLDRGVSRWSVLLQVFKRSLLIAAIGLALNAIADPGFSHLRYYGVLQRIALCYLLGGIVFLFGRVSACAAAIVVALFGYWLLIVHLPVPGSGVPGVNVALLDPYGNMASWLDRLLVPASHLYRHGIYDPEGLLSTIPAVATTLFGTLAAAWLRTARPSAKKAVVLFGAGLIVIVAGLLWSHSFPLNKRLWTSSFVLFNAGIAMAVFAALFWFVDASPSIAAAKKRVLAPWLVFGTNALTAYVLSEVLAILLAAIPVDHRSNLQRWLFQLLPSWLGPPPFVSMIYSILFVAVCFLPVMELYRRRIFIKL